MRKIFLSLFIFCFQLFGAAQLNTKIDVLHYKYEIKLNDNNDIIYGKAEITILRPFYLTNFDLDLNKIDRSGKGMVIDTIKTIIGHRTFDLPQFANSNFFWDSMGRHIGYYHDTEKIYLNHYEGGRRDAALAREIDTSTVTIYYHGIPNDGLIISKTKYGRRSFFADNWPDRGHNWIPCHDDPADKATVEFIVTAPEHYQVVANGIQIEETTLGNGFKTTHWKEDTPISTKVMVIGVADFAVNLSGFVNGCIPVYSWVYPEDRVNGFNDYSQANEILEYYIGHIGPYGYKKLANVQSKTRFGGLENANTIFYAENSVTGTKKSEGLLAHEIAHQWFGNMATEKSFGHLWLSEGFATYFTILYFENKYGKDTSKQMRVEDRAQTIEFSKRNNKAVVNTEETDYMNLLNANSYQKGGWVLHMLRSELGDSVFWKSIRKYYATYSHGIADTRDLEKVFEEVSVKDLKQFFDQWLYTPGQPDLDIKWSYNEQSKEISVTVEQKQQYNFMFPLKIGIKYSSGKKTNQQFYIDKMAKTFTVKVSEKPMSLIADPDVELLAGYSVKESK